MLAFACAFTMFAGAAFTDQADFAVKTDVVDTLVQLGVINGYTDGSFKPNGTVTRAEMAKMIYVLRTGNSDASAYNDDKTSFTDIGTHWARGYIKYCQSLGIIAGKSNTRFDPNGNVTAQEAAKMLLVTLGYNAEKAGLTGAGWASKTNALADENGLLEDVNTSFTAACPRQYAAQLIYNTIDTPTVVWRDDAYTNVDVLNRDNQTVGEKYMNLVKDEAATGAHDNILTKVEKEDGRDTYTITVSGAVYTRVAKDYSDLIGQDVVVMYKKNDTSKVFGVYAAEDSKVIASGTVGQLESISGETKKTKLNGTEYKLDDVKSTVTVIEPNSTATDTLANLESYTAIDKVAGTVKLVDNDGDNKVDTLVYTPVTVGQITYAGSKSVTINNGVGANDVDDLNIYDGYAKDDWTVVTADTYTSSGDTAVAKIDVVTSKVASVKSSTPKEVKINDSWYKIATGSVADDTASVKSGSTYDFAIVGNYVVNAKETEAASTDVLVVTDYESTSTGMQGTTTQKVKAYFLDGSSKTIEVEKLSLTAGTDESDVDRSSNNIDSDDVNKLYTYSTRSNGTYTLKALGSGNKAGYESAVNLKSGNITGSNKIDNFSISDDAVVFALYGSATNGVRHDVKVLTGKTVNDWKTGYGSQVAYATKKSNGIETVRVAVVVDNSKYSGAGSDYKYAYMTSDSYEGTNGEDNDKTTVYEAWTGSENVTLKYDGASGTTKHAGDVLIYTDDGVDFINIETASDVNVVKVAITGIEKAKEGDVAVRFANGSSDTYSMDEDCVYIAVNDDKQEGMEGSSLDQISLAEEHTSGKYYANAWIVVENTGDKNIMAIIYDADNNRLDGNLLF
mgnify:CR=1 FL=1